MTELSSEHAHQALSMAGDESIPLSDRVDMLVEIAAGLQSRPKSAEQIHSAVKLYRRALDLVPESETLGRGRIRARMATALHMIPEPGSTSLLAARDALEQAIKQLADGGSAEEIAEAEMNLGLVLQSLASSHQARLTDAIAAYHRALRTFTRDDHPTEFAIIHNNLATAYLSIPLSDERHKMREALAVQSFEHALEIVNLVDHPSEYAMLQNNLGNALQYASSAHAVANNLRALEAYDEALKVRTPQTTPLPYANTIANKANAFRNLPDDPDNLEAGNRKNLERARELYFEAAAIFANCGDSERADYAANTAAELTAEIDANTPWRTNGHTDTHS